MEMRFLLAAVLLLLFSIASYAYVTEFFANIQPAVEYLCEGCNVLFITVDTLRADHVSSYGYFQETTPNIDKLASGGVMFLNAFSQIPHTPPSHWSMFTGLYPQRHGKYTPLDDGGDVLSLPEILSENGYVTAGFISSQILTGLETEFSHFNMGTSGKKVPRKEAGETTEEVLSWLDEHSSERFFLWVHYFDPHSPYEPPAETDVFDYGDSPKYSDKRYNEDGISRHRTMREEIAKYDGEILYTDINVGMLIDKLSEKGIDGDTLVVLMSDHGECFGEHNFTDFGYEKERACVFHGKTLYDEEVRIPFIIMNPRSSIANLRVGGITETVDVFPTVLQILGLDALSHDTDGRGLADMIKGSDAGKPYSVMHTEPIRGGALAAGLRTDEWKFVRVLPGEMWLDKEISEQDGGPSGETGGAVTSETNKLLKPSEGEKTDFIQSEPMVASRLESLLSEEFSGDWFNYETEVDNDTIKMLISLGYMQ